MQESSDYEGSEAPQMDPANGTITFAYTVTYDPKYGITVQPDNEATEISGFGPTIFPASAYDFDDWALQSLSAYFGFMGLAETFWPPILHDTYGK